MANLWEETIDAQGKSSLSTHKLKTLQVGCEEGKHHFVFSGGSLREAHCKDCNIIVPYILGYHTITDGKIKTAKV